MAHLVTIAMSRLLGMQEVDLIAFDYGNSDIDFAKQVDGMLLMLLQLWFLGSSWICPGYALRAFLLHSQSLLGAVNSILM